MMKREFVISVISLLKHSHRILDSTCIFSSIGNHKNVTVAIDHAIKHVQTMTSS